jgi:hypothetical protein
VSRFRRQRQIIKHIIMLLAIPLAVTGTGYAAFSQNLSVSGTSTVPGYTASQNLSVSYDMSSCTSAPCTYSINPMTLKYNGVNQIIGWQVQFDLPSDFTNLSCTGATCTSSGQTVTAVNTETNGTIAAGGTVMFTASFQTATTSYVLQNLNVSGTEAPVWQTMSGLSVSVVAGSRSQSGSDYLWPDTFTVTNDSGQEISAWQIQTDWDSSTNVVSSMPSGVTYSTSATHLTIQSTTGLANGDSYQFTPTLGSTNSSWSLTGDTVKGSL